jgi:hypothetical protein
VRLFDGLLQKLRDPAAAVGRAQVEQARQGGDKRIEGPEVAAEESADDRCKPA